MKLLAVDNYVNFECIGGECPISCCGGNWGIVIDDKSMEYYMSVDGEFGDELKNGIVKMNDANMFKLDEKTKDCIFLNENKLCRIYRKLGPEALCYTCRTYPRDMIQIGDIMFCFLSNSCPEVNRMIMQREDMLQTLFDDKNLEMDENEKKDAYKTDWKKFNDAIRGFTTGMHVMQNREISFKDRLFIILFYVERIQKLMSENKDVSDFIELFSKPEVYSLFLENRKAYSPEYADKIHVFMIIYKTLIQYSYKHSMLKRCVELAEDILNKRETDTELLKQSFIRCNDSEDIQRELEQIMTYRYFAVFMQGFNNEDFMEKMAYEVIMLATLESYIALTEVFQKRKCTQEERILFYSLCGRIDHSQKQKKKLVDELKEEGFFNLDRLIRLVN